MDDPRWLPPALKALPLQLQLQFLRVLRVKAVHHGNSFATFATFATFALMLFSRQPDNDARQPVTPRRDRSNAAAD